MNTLFNQPLKVVNAGLHSFADNIQHAGGHAISLNWQPPAQGDIDTGLVLASLLRHPLVESANQIAMTRYLEAQPVLVDVMLAKEAIPEMAEQKRILHSGPPIAREDMCGPVKGGDYWCHAVRRLGYKPERRRKPDKRRRNRPCSLSSLSRGWTNGRHYQPVYAIMGGGKQNQRPSYF